MATSKNNPDARRIEGWRCPKCGTPNSSVATVCRGRTSTRLLSPAANGRNLKVTMEHAPCGNVRAA